MLSPHNADLREAVYDPVSVILSKAMSKDIELDINIDPQTPPQLFFDEYRVRQVLTNLLSNAIKFTSKGSITTDIAYTPMSLGRGKLDCTVTDTGIGIEPGETRIDLRTFHTRRWQYYSTVWRHRFRACDLSPAY